MWTKSKFGALAALIALAPLASAVPQRTSIPGYGDVYPSSSASSSSQSSATNLNTDNRDDTAQANGTRIGSVGSMDGNGMNSTGCEGSALPTNVGYVSNGRLHAPTPEAHVPAGGLGLNDTVWVHGDRSTGYGQYNNGTKYGIPFNASFAGAAKSDPNSPTKLNAAGVWNGTYALNSTEATYHPLSDFDYQSLQLALYQEFIELDLFYQGLQQFSVQEFNNSGITPEDMELIEFMAGQEVGHARLIGNMLGPTAPKPCTYSYPFNTVPEFIAFSQRLTRWGESGVLGFIEHLDSRPSAQMLLQSITTESRQQMIFRQFQKLFPMPVFYETGISQSMAWTLLAPHIVSCPAENQKMIWQNFPTLHITGSTAVDGTTFNATQLNFTAPDIDDLKIEVTHNRTLTEAGNLINLSWEQPGRPVGPNGTYITSVSPMAGQPRYAAWISQLNTTYVPLENLQGNSAMVRQPYGTVYEGINDPVINGTMFVAIVDQDIFVTPFNMSRLNDHIIAGPAIYQSG